MVAVQRNLSKFGIKEVARTGKVILIEKRLRPYPTFCSFLDLMGLITVIDSSAA
jgi:hypothetical protein